MSEEFIPQSSEGEHVPTSGDLSEKILNQAFALASGAQEEPSDNEPEDAEPVEEPTPVDSEQQQEQEEPPAKKEQPAKPGMKKGSKVISPAAKDAAERQWGVLRNENKDLKEKYGTAQSRIAELESQLANAVTREEHERAIVEINEQLQKANERVRVSEVKDSEEFKGLQTQAYEAMNNVAEELGVDGIEIERIVYSETEKEREELTEKLLRKLQAEKSLDAFQLSRFERKLDKTFDRIGYLNSEANRIIQEAADRREQLNNDVALTIAAINEKMGWEFMQEDDLQGMDAFSALMKKTDSFIAEGIDYYNKYKSLHEEHDALQKKYDELEKQLGKAKTEKSATEKYLEKKAGGASKAKPSIGNAGAPAPDKTFKVNGTMPPDFSKFAASLLGRRPN